MRVRVVCADWLAAFADHSFDMIVSNPPYIADNDPHLTQGDVRFEPRSALVAADNGFADLHALIVDARRVLKSAGWLVLEHGYRQAAGVRAFLAENGYTNVASHVDLGGNERITVGQLSQGETGTPDLAFARKFAEGIRKKYPGKMLAYNCSPSFNWKRNLDDASIAKFQRELGAMGYKFQFITLAGFHALNYSMFELAHGYARGHMSAFVELQQKEFAAAEKGFTAVKHQREVGTGYFDEVTQVVTGGKASTTALHGSTEDEQFFESPKKPKLAAA